MPTLLNIDMLSHKALEGFNITPSLISVADRQYEGSFAKTGGKIGTVLRVRDTVRMSAVKQRALSVNEITEKSKDFTVATQAQVSWAFNHDDMTMSLDEYDQRYLKPAVATLVNTCEIDGFAKYKECFNVSGSAGTDPATRLVWTQAKARLKSYNVPSGPLYGFVSSGAEAAMVGGTDMQNFFHNGAALDKMYATGEIGSYAGIKFMCSENVPNHTNGTNAENALTNGTVTSGTSIVLDSITDNGTFTVGTSFTVADCYQVNPLTKETTQNLQIFTVTAAATGATDDVTLTVTPEIIVSGPYQNVSSTGVVDEKAVTFVTGITASAVTAQNIVMHPSALSLVTADLPMEPDATMRIVRDSNVSMRLARVYDAINDRTVWRLDMLYGWSLLRPEWMCRVLGA